MFLLSGALIRSKPARSLHRPTLSFRPSGFNVEMDECSQCSGLSVNTLIETRWHALDLTPPRGVSVQNSRLICLIGVWPVKNGFQIQGGPSRNMCLDWSNDTLHVINLLSDTVYHCREPARRIWHDFYKAQGGFPFSTILLAWSENECGKFVDKREKHIHGWSVATDEEIGYWYSTIYAVWWIVNTLWVYHYVGHV